MTPALIGFALLVGIVFLWVLRILDDPETFGQGDYDAAQAAQHEASQVPTTQK